MTEKAPKSWWQTMPGILTGIAGIVTALATLVVALSQAGILVSNDNQGNDKSLVPPQGGGTVTSTAEVEAVIDDPDGYTNVRSGPSSEHDIIARVAESEVFYVTPQPKNDWWPVRTQDDVFGYLHRSRIMLQN